MAASLFRRSPGVVGSGSMAVLVAIAYLLAAPMGRDLSAQLAHAQLVRRTGPSFWISVGMAVSTRSAIAFCLLL